MYQSCDNKVKFVLFFIVAAASLKFTNVEREVFAEMFVKALAGASDWNGRKLIALQKC